MASDLETASRGRASGKGGLHRWSWRGGAPAEVGAHAASVTAGRTDARGRGPHDQAARSSAVAAVALPALVLLIGGFRQRWMGDDGFINVRVAEQMLVGNGMVFNAGERSEAITSPGWVLLLYGAGLLGLRLDDAAWLLSLFFSAAGVVLAGLGSAALEARRGAGVRWCVPFGLLCYACLPPAWDYATSGLENGLGVAWLGSSFWALSRCALSEEPRARRLYGSAALLSLAPLVRPDYVLFSGPLSLLLCSQASGVWRRLSLLATGIAAGAGYEIFRMGYYASLVPNTALAKEAFLPRWDQGLKYFWNSAGLYWLLVPIACVLCHLLTSLTRTSEPNRAARALAPTLAISGALHLGYVTRVGGDFMHGRMLLPGLFALFSAAGMLALPRLPWSPSAVLRAGSAAVAGIWCVICAASLRVATENQFGIGDERGWYARKAGHPNPTRLEHYENFGFHRTAQRIADQLAAKCPRPGPFSAPAEGSECQRVLVTNAEDGKLNDQRRSAILPLDVHAVPRDVDAVVAFRPLGIASGVLGPRVTLVDYFGLADPVASRLAVARRGRPGHEKTFGTAWLAAKYAAPGATRDRAVRAARRALGCGALAELGRATREPLDFSRFTLNVRLALALRDLRVPADPIAAEQLFCRTSTQYPVTQAAPFVDSR